MKMLIPLFFLLIVGCTKSTPTVQLSEIAEDSVYAYLMRELNDPNSYQPVNFADFDSSFSKAKYVKYYLSLFDSVFELRENFSFLDKERERLLNLSQTYLDSADKIDSDTTFIGDFDGYTISHTYRANNNFGALVLSTQIFHLDTNLTVDKSFTK